VTPKLENALCAPPCFRKRPFRPHRRPPFDLGRKTQVPPRQAPLRWCRVHCRSCEAIPCPCRILQSNKSAKPSAFLSVGSVSDRSPTSTAPFGAVPFAPDEGALCRDYAQGVRSTVHNLNSVFLCLNQVSECYGGENRNQPTDLAVFLGAVGSESLEVGFRKSRMAVPKLSTLGSESLESSWNPSPRFCTDRRARSGSLNLELLWVRFPKSRTAVP
jgi:hypothetical protein